MLYIYIYIYIYGSMRRDHCALEKIHDNVVRAQDILGKCLGKSWDTRFLTRNTIPFC